MEPTSAGLTEPVDIEGDTKKIKFLSKANELFQRPAEPRNSRSEPSIQKAQSAMEKQRKISTQTSGAWPPAYLQPPDCPRFEQPDPVQHTKREAELESAVKILSMKLDYTQRKIMESENNKELLKAKLDHLINNLTRAGYDPNLKVAQRPTSGPNGVRRSPTANERAGKYSQRLPPGPEQYRDLSAYAGQVQTYRPDARKMSNASWEKLRELADEYERRLVLIKSLEEQEKYVKSQMTTPVNITVPSIMGSPRLGPEHPR